MEKILKCPHCEEETTFRKSVVYVEYSSMQYDLSCEDGKIVEKYAGDSCSGTDPIDDDEGGTSITCECCGEEVNEDEIIIADAEVTEETPA